MCAMLHGMLLLKVLLNGTKTYLEGNFSFFLSKIIDGIGSELAPCTIFYVYQANVNFTQ